MEKYIGDTLFALEKQTYKSFEVIIVDDGSTDKGHEIVQQYINRGNLRINYIRQENQGVSTARNVGIDNAETKYLFFCDADDILPYRTLELVLQYAKEYDVVAGFASRENNVFESTKRNSSGTIQKGIEYLRHKYLFENSKMQFCSFLYKASILNQFQIRFSSDLKYGEDEEFAWKYLCHCQSALFLNTIIYCYRINPQSASNQLSYQRVQVIESMMRVTQYYMSVNNDFYKLFAKYGIVKAKMSILRQFARTNNYDLYYKLVKSERYHSNMLSLLLFPDLKIKLAVLIYTISHSLFYKLFQKFKF